MGRNALLGILTIGTCLFASQPSGRPHSIGMGADVDYVGPYVWRGIRMTQGSCLQPTLWAAYGEFRASAFVNMYGSTRDLGYGGRDGELRPIPLKGPGSKSLFEINEVKLHLDWNHAFTETFSLLVGYTHLAYAAEYDDFGEFEEYAWFSGRSSHGEVTLKPSLRVGPFTLFTEANLIAFAGSYDKEVFGPTGADTVSVSDKWNYQQSFGVTFSSRPADMFAFELTLLENFANEGFLSKWVKDKQTAEGVDAAGFYSTSFELATRYTPVRWFSLSPGAGVEIITNDKVSNNFMNGEEEVRGALFYGGLRSSFTW